MRVVPDYTQGEWSEFPDGRRAVRSFLVLDLAGTSDAQLKDAAEAVGVPARGDPHPQDAGIVVIDKSSRPVNDATAIVTCTYEIPSWNNSPESVSQEITLDASVIEDKTYFDINGVRISASYTGAVLVTHYPSATIATSLVTATINKLESTTESDLLLRAVDYVETVNNAAWFGWPAKTWKMEDLQVRPSRFNAYREVTYVLTYKPSDWRFLATYIDAGRVPPDATEGNGFARWDVRPLTDFSALPITVPTMPP